MSEEEDLTEEENEAPAPQMPLFNFRRFLWIFLGILAIMVMFDTNLRESLGTVIGGPLFVVFGFDGKYPFLTLFFVGSLMIVFSTIVREMMMDWVEMAEIQKKTSAFNKERMDARMNNKTTKLKKLDKLQPEISTMQMKTMKPQIKSMAATMVVIIAIFASLWTFLGDLPNKSYSVPWALNAGFMTNIGPLPFPQWIGAYMLVSIPIGQAFRLGLQIVTFKKRLNEVDVENGL